MCWRLALWARFRDGGRTGTMLREFLQPVDPAAKISCGANGGIYPNLFSAHPPFQIDANLGVPAGIVEMLVQCHRQADDGVMVVDLLPALPANWTAGKLTGVRLRNGIFLDLVWRESRVAGMRIRALNQTYDSAPMLAYVIVIGLIGVALDNIIKLLERKLTGWQEKREI